MQRTHRRCKCSLFAGRPAQYNKTETSVELCYWSHGYCVWMDRWSSCRRAHSAVRAGRRSKAFSLSDRSSFVRRRCYWLCKSATAAGTDPSCLRLVVVVTSPSVGGKHRANPQVRQHPVLFVHSSMSICIAPGRVEGQVKPVNLDFCRSLHVSSFRFWILIQQFTFHHLSFFFRKGDET